MTDPINSHRLVAPEEVWLAEPDDDLSSSGSALCPALIWRAGKDQFELDDGGIVGIKLETIKAPSIDMFNRFLRISDDRTADHAIIDFVKTWGPLGICHCGLPAVHNLPQPSLNYELPSWHDEITFERRTAVDQCFPLDTADLPRSYVSPAVQWETRLGIPESKIITEVLVLGPALWEPTEAWRAYSRTFRALLNIAHDLIHGDGSRLRKIDTWIDAWFGKPTPRDIGQLCESDYWKQHPHEVEERLIDVAERMDRRSAALELTRIIKGLFSAAGILPTVGFRTDTGEVQFISTLGVHGFPMQGIAYRSTQQVWPGSSVFGLLVCQLAGVLISSDRIYCCYFCKQPFAIEESDKRRRSDQRICCGAPECLVKRKKGDDAKYREPGYVSKSRRDVR